MNEGLIAQFPALQQEVHQRRLVYLDNAATTHRPRRVLDAMTRFYETDNANIHRGVHALSQRATDSFENARKTLQGFLNAPEAAEIIFTKGCTEAINLAAYAWGLSHLQEGDLILLSHAEHHANIVPWQLIAERVGARIEPIPIYETGEIDLEGFAAQLAQGAKIVGVKHVCNTLGTINPIAEMTQMAHAAGALILVDGAQAPAHLRVDVQALGVDFYAISAHKMYGPMGVGALWARRELLEAMTPWQGGGDMIRTVSFEGTTFNDIPNKFEPGTQNVAGVIGWSEAIRFLEEVGVENAALHETALRFEAEEELNSIPGLKVVGNAVDKAGVISFTIDGIHPHDIGTILDHHGVAIRTGHHCCMPLMRRLGLPATARASLAMYNTNQDIKVLIEAVNNARAIFA